MEIIIIPKLFKKPTIIQIFWKETTKEITTLTMKIQNTPMNSILWIVIS